MNAHFLKTPAHTWSNRAGLVVAAENLRHASMTHAQLPGDVARPHSLKTIEVTVFANSPCSQLSLEELLGKWDTVAKRHNSSLGSHTW